MACCINLNETKGREILWLLVAFVARPFRLESHGSQGRNCDIRYSDAGTVAIVVLEAIVLSESATNDRWHRPF